MRRGRRLMLLGYAGLAATSLIFSVLGLIALNAGGEAGPFAIAAGYDRSAQQILADPMSLAQRRRADRLSRQAIAQFPYDTGAWLRLAYLDSVEHHGLSALGVQYLQRSYDLIAVDPDIGVGRVGVALENSQALSPDLRQTVRAEASALWKNPSRRQALKLMLPTISNPAGRLSLALWLNRLEAAEPRPTG